ncbi:hypothetical protein PHBOTO_002626 [Pseudozyma hubeiensis]|nr:hypothetical protein PHBOTO_002626 [Pseudozyma hubeiensis]
MDGEAAEEFVTERKITVSLVCAHSKKELVPAAQHTESSPASTLQKAQLQLPSTWSSLVSGATLLDSLLAFSLSGLRAVRDTRQPAAFGTEASKRHQGDRLAKQQSTIGTRLDRQCAGRYPRRLHQLAKRQEHHPVAAVCCDFPLGEPDELCIFCNAVQRGTAILGKIRRLYRPTKLPTASSRGASLESKRTAKHRCSERKSSINGSEESGH